MATSATRKAPVTEEVTWRRAAANTTTSTPAPNTRGTPRTRTRGGRTPREGSGSNNARDSATPGTSARASPDIKSAFTKSTTAAPGHVTTKEGSKAKPTVAATSAERPSRHTGRPTVPALTVQSSTPTAESFASPDSALPSANPSRRKRSQNRNKTPSPVPRKTSSPTVMTAGSTATHSPVRDAQPASSSTQLNRSKDAPPHLLGSATPSVDVATSNMQHQVEALVKQMRAAAVIPTTPTTVPTPTATTTREPSPHAPHAYTAPHAPASGHLDWAGDDDDDELPDLNDWGYTSKPTLDVPLVHVDVISPILENSLKSLPFVGPVDLAIERSRSSTSDSQTAVEGSVDGHKKDDDEPVDSAHSAAAPEDVSPTNQSHSRPKSPEKLKSRRGARAKTSKNGKDEPIQRVDVQARTVAARAVASALASAKKDTAMPVKEPTFEKAKPSPLLHPSLPPKPIMSPTEKPASLPAKPVVSPVQPTIALPLKPSIEAVNQSGTTDLARVAASVTAPTLLEVHTPKDSPLKPLSGLSASIHAVSASVDEDIASRSAPSGVSTFGQGNAVRGDKSTGPSPRAPRTPRDRDNRPKSVHMPPGGFNGAHTRTQSVPAVPSRGPRSPGTVRPVIAGSAISMLAKTLGNSPQRK